jgi:L-alanine-DL-glutamate epimerase-like enolase superfamily enzyme
MYRDLDNKIIDVEGHALSSPYGDGKSLGQPLGVKSIGIVRIFVDSGDYGLGETYVGVYAPELIKPIVEFLKPYLLGKKIGSNQYYDVINNLPFIGGSGLLQSVLSAIEIAIWDLRGKLLNVQTFKLLSKEYRNKIPVYASSGSAAMSADEIEVDVNNILNDGHDAYKMRVGFKDWREDLNRVERASNILKLSKKDLMVDAIMGTLRPAWSLEIAKKSIQDLSVFNLIWIEEPLLPANIGSLIELKQLNLVPIAAGEAYSCNRDYEKIIQDSSVDYLQFDATHSGGIYYCCELAAQAQKKQMKSALHVWGSAIAISANASVGLACPSIDILEIPMVALDITDEMWLEKPTIVNGFLYQSKIPGLGVRIDDKILNKYKFIPQSGYKL